MAIALDERHAPVRTPEMLHRLLRTTIAVSLLLASHAGAAEATQAALLKTCAAEKHLFTPKVRTAYLEYAKAQALADLQAQKRTLPSDFLKWVDADPIVQASVYGGHVKPSDVLLQLYALRLDLGKEKFEKYCQLMLATAIVHAKRAADANITPHKPIAITIGGDPRKPVDTKDPKRELDRNDHIINFLNGNTIEEEVVVGYKMETPPLKYDERGIAIPAPKKAKPKKVPVTERRTRSLYAADVLASRALQEKFNAYMKAKGHPVDIDCGDKVIHWKSHDMVRGNQIFKIAAAFKLFREAYEAKGLLPARPDPVPSPGERCVYMIRNYDHVFPPELQKQRNWPRYPLTAPWPVLTVLVDADYPLREREERWVAFRDKGEFKTYGEYIGGIAQQFDMQSARRLKPYLYTYGTIQMMLKDGGVCGTMGAIAARSQTALGIPACQAAQPGHCAVAAFQYDPKTETYHCKGQQYATGGDDRTTPFARWFFGDAAKKYDRHTGFGLQRNPRKPMVYHQSVAWAVNYSFPSFLDTLLACNTYQLLDEDARKGPGIALLTSALKANPYGLLLIDTAQASADPKGQMTLWKAFQAALAAVGKKPGCPTDGLYPATVKKNLFARLAKLPVPEDERDAREIYAFLEQEQCSVPAALVAYRLKLEGLPALLKRAEADLKAHFAAVQTRASRENDTDTAAMAETIKAVAAAIRNGKERRTWAQTLWPLTKGNERFLGHRNRVATSPVVVQIARQAGQKMLAEAEQMQPLLDRIVSELQASVAGERDIKACRALATKLQAVGNAVKDADQKRAWAAALTKAMAGKETFKPPKARKPLRDPCADVVKKIADAAQ